MQVHHEHVAATKAALNRSINNLRKEIDYMEEATPRLEPAMRRFSVMLILGNNHMVRFSMEATGRKDILDFIKENVLQDSDNKHVLNVRAL